MACCEIGSEFWENCVLKQGEKNRIVFNERRRGFLCGRTALEHIIRDAKKEWKEKWTSILLPSYCCGTMIEPFLKNGINVRFYSVISSESGLECILPIPEENEAIYLIQYFGHVQQGQYISEELQQWLFSILDETHSCFADSQMDYEEWNVKYTYTSYRKWSDIRGFAIAEKIEGDFLLRLPEQNCPLYMKYKEEACLKKKKYMEDGEGEKEDFLELYRKAEALLDGEYWDCKAMKEGILAYEKLNISEMKGKRRENASYLMKHLKGNEKVQLLFSEYSVEDSPLMVPILVKNEQRDILRKYLIEKSIYCPVHWPITELHQLKSEREYELYNQELSLICDQRYGIEEMQKIIDEINKFCAKL